MQDRRSWDFIEAFQFAPGAAETRMARNANWEFVRDFRWDARVPEWNEQAAWWESAKMLFERDAREILDPAAKWDVALADLGGDPCRTDWSRFRPLRRHREEDWSDWLAHLIEASRSGEFARSLLGNAYDESTSFIAERVEREVSVDGRRADLVIIWKDNSFSHIEVELWDPELEKTTETAALVEARLEARRRSDHLLIPTESRAAWDRVERPSTERIRVATWLDVVVALRCCLLRKDAELTAWRVWAHTFVGAIERDILGWDALGRGAESLRSSRPGTHRARLEIMRRELPDEPT